MALQEVKDAQYKYQKVIYSHIPISPAEPMSLTADPWSFLHGHLLTKIESSRGENCSNYKRAKYYSTLAEDYYRAAESVAMPAQGTLLYYGMMNLVKALLAVNKVKLETVVEHHGVTNTHDKKHILTISGNLRDCTNIFKEFASLMGTPVAGKHEIPLRKIVPFIPEIHGIVKSLNIFRRPKYLPIDIKFKVNEAASYLMTELSYKKGLDNVSDTSKVLKGERKEYFQDSYERDHQVIYRSKRRKRITQTNWPSIYGNILKEYKKLGITSLLTRNGYRYYCSLEKGDYHHLCNSYLLMFYLGHTARYRPTEMEEIMNGKWRPIATEAVAILPKQFLYQLVSLITGRLCVIPFSDI
jgi:hypothetical protein